MVLIIRCKTWRIPPPRNVIIGVFDKNDWLSKKLGIVRVWTAFNGTISSDGPSSLLLEASWGSCCITTCGTIECWTFVVPEPRGHLFLLAKCKVVPLWPRPVQIHSSADHNSASRNKPLGGQQRLAIADSSRYESQLCRGLKRSWTADGSQTPFWNP